MNPSHDEHQQQHAASWWAYSSSPAAAAPGGGVGNLAPDQSSGTGYLPTHQQHTLQGHSSIAPGNYAPQPNYILQPQVPLPFQQPHEHFRLPSGGSMHSAFIPPQPHHASTSTAHGMVQGMPHSLSPVLTQDSSIIDSSSSDSPVKKKVRRGSLGECVGTTTRD